MEKIKTRFAPSPTGFLHVGGLRSALFAYLFAKAFGGDFVLRIEDTDRRRYVEGATEDLIKMILKMGLEFDEGPDLEEGEIKGVKGENGPYLQSERLDIYQNHVQKLLDQGKAYYCFCTEERLKKMREGQMERREAPKYDGCCRNLSQDEIDQKLNTNTPYVVRMKIPENETIEFNDLIRGSVVFSTSEVDDQVILKSDGYPTYHLAVVVDDHLMGITHVVRGEEWISSTPKHILLYRYFGWDLPGFAHLPLILNPDKSKLSKRQGDVAVEDYLEKGYLPEALLNFVALLGWNPSVIDEETGKEKEIFSLEEMINLFSIDKVNKSGAVFNNEKLDWLNGAYIRKMEIEELTEKCLSYFLKEEVFKQDNDNFYIPDSGEIFDIDWLEKVVALEQERMKKLSDITEATGFIFAGELSYEKELLIWKNLTEAQVKENLDLARDILDSIDEDDFTKENIEEVLRATLTEKGLKPGELLWPLRVALTGQKNSPGPFEVADVLGKEKSLNRVDEAMEML